MIRPMRIILKPYSLHDDNASEGHAYWRATTDFPCTKNGKSAFGIGIDKQTALASLCHYLPQDMRDAIMKLKEEQMYVMPDQIGFTYWQVNLDGSRPSDDEWLYERQYYNRFGHLPID